MVYSETEHQWIYSISPNIKTPISQRDAAKYFQYYRDVDHTTNDCQALKDEVESFIRWGQLWEYVRGANKQPQQNTSTTRRSTWWLRYWGPCHHWWTGDTNRTRKNYSRHARSKPFTRQVNLTEQRAKVPHLFDDLVTFTEEESRGLWHPHNDAIVVNLRRYGDIICTKPVVKSISIIRVWSTFSLKKSWIWDNEDG